MLPCPLGRVDQGGAGRTDQVGDEVDPLDRPFDVMDQTDQGGDDRTDQGGDDIDPLDRSFDVMDRDMDRPEDVLERYV